MEEVTKSIKVNCSFCGKEIECPEDMLKAKQHMCYECFQTRDNLTEIDFDKVHIDMPRDAFDETMLEHLTDVLVETVFPEVWKERKGDLKEMSKRELAQEMFGAGAYIALMGEREMKNEIEETERKIPREKESP